MVLDEPAIIAACQEGHTEQFAHMYDHYSDRIYRFIYYRTHHRQTAEDLTSVVFIKAFEHIKKFNAVKGAFSSWLYQIARNTVIDHYRSVVPTESIDTIWDIADNTDIPRDIEATRNLQKVFEYLQTLSSKQKDIILMRVWDELSYKEIAEVLGKTEANCRVLFSRTIQKIITALGPMSLLYFILMNRI